jgi:hypothetical protein
MESEENKIKFGQQFVGMVAGFSLATSCLLCPFVFDRYLAVSPLLEQEEQLLAVFSMLLFSIAVLFFLLRKRLKLGWVLFYFSCLALIQVELASRLMIHYFSSFERREELGIAANRTYLDYTAYKGHPFLVFTGRPAIELTGNNSLGNLSAFNNFGFSGKDFIVEKSAETIRVIAMGGSTTISGYPAYTERFLNDSLLAKEKYEVLNFGMTYWTSAHSLVNFVLNVVDFQPDYVVFHHAWNDEKARNFPEETFRNDYSHALTYFHEPEIPDKWPFRISILYRMFKEQLGIQPEWASLGTATSVKNDAVVTPLYQNKKELYPYERNIRSIVDLAKARNIRVLLTTQPRSTDPNIPFYYAAPAIDQGNEILREVATSYGDEVVFLDLDSLFTGKRNELFIDLGHMSEEGIRLKGEAIAKAISNDRLTNTSEK